MAAGLGRNVTANMANAVAQIGAAIVGVPLILHIVGISGYGVWTLAQTVLVYVSTAEGGLGPGVQRFTAVAGGAGRTDEVKRLLWTSAVLYTVVGLVIAGAAVALAPALTDLFDVRGALREDAIAMFRWTGPIMLVALLGAGLGNIQQGVDRFVGFAFTALSGSIVFLAGLAVVVETGGGLRDVALCALAQQAAMLLTRAWMMRDLLFSRPVLLRRGELRAILSFSARLQMSVLGTLINNQTDKIVVGLLRNTAQVGQLGIGGQIAEAGRLVGGAALSPLVTRFSSVHAVEHPDEVRALYVRVNRLWFVLVIGSVTIGTAVLQPLIEGWLGDGHDRAALLGGFLVVAYGASLLSGTSVAYLRAIGRPGIEARYGAVLIALNVTLTVALGIAFGPVGVVAATTLAYVLGTAWFFIRVAATVPGAFAGFGALVARIVPGATLAAAAALGWSLASVAVLPTGVALVGVGIGAAVALAVYVTWALEHSVSRAALRRVLALRG